MGDGEEVGAVGADEVGEGGYGFCAGAGEGGEEAGLEVVGDALGLGLFGVVEAVGF